MKTFQTLIVLLVTLGLTQILIGQSKFSTTAVSTTVAGTSTLHDWEMKSSTGTCTLTAQTDASGNITAISDMKFALVAKTLKSGKGAMDKNAYSALKADKYANITADLKSAKVSTKDNVNYTVNAVVSLTIAGKTKDIDMTVAMKKINANSYSVSTKKKINMVEYGVEPPSFMMGTVTTGKDVDISFNFNINK